MCRKNKIFADHWEKSGESYLAAIYLMNLIESETTGYEFEPKRVKNRNTQKIGVYSRYTTTIMDVNKETFRDAISINKYIENECFINSIYDFYHDKLLSPDKKRNRITRAKILEIIGRTEEDVKIGRAHV